VRAEFKAPAAPLPFYTRIEASLKIIASQVRKGNVLEVDSQLYVVLTAENFHPGKGTPTTQIDMRRISDGVKVSQRYKTTEQVERAFVEDVDFQYLFKDGDGYTFMNSQTYDQVHVPEDIIGDYAPYLQENMPVKISLHEGNPIAIEIPQRVTLEVVETEPVTKGQTAASSYKPAIMSNGIRVMVPPHIGPGTRIVVMTADGTYAERAKD
jgi:elongation factor P